MAKSKAKTAAKAAAKVAVAEPVKRTTQLQELDGVRVVEVTREGGIDGGGAGTGGRLRVILEGNSVERLLLPATRKLAYVQRFDHGMANAGIESEGGTYVPPDEMTDARSAQRNVNRWRIDFIITPMI